MTDSWRSMNPTLLHRYLQYPAVQKKGTARAHPAVQKKGTVRAPPAVLKKGTVRAHPAVQKKGTARPTLLC